MAITLASVVVPAMIVARVAGLCLGAAGPVDLTAQVSQGGYIPSLVDTSVKNSTKYLLLSGIAARVTKAGVKTGRRERVC